MDEGISERTASDSRNFFFKEFFEMKKLLREAKWLKDVELIYMAWCDMETFLVAYFPQEERNKYHELVKTFMQRVYSQTEFDMLVKVRSNQTAQWTSAQWKKFNDWSANLIMDLRNAEEELYVQQKIAGLGLPQELASKQGARMNTYG